MDRSSGASLYSYSWHQSHDQATVLLLVPYGAHDEDVEVVFERDFVVAGVRGQSPIVKGRLYGNIDVNNCLWQLEPRPSSRSRVRTISTTSSASTPSSYAFVSDPDISSSFAASLENAQTSDSDDVAANASPILSSPPSPRSDERISAATHDHRRHAASRASSSRAVSPGHVSQSLASSFSSLESLHNSSRLLTLHLEKEQPVIWPSLIVGPVSESISPYPLGPLPNFDGKYNMDPTSMVLIAFELYDVRRAKEDAFEYFIRAWHQARTPAATVRLVTYYVPVHLTLDLPSSSAAEATRGTIAYYIQSLGGPWGLAQLYFDAGLLHLEGAAAALLGSSSASLSSIRIPLQPLGEWKRDRDAASRYFERARALDPDLEPPLLPPEGDAHPSSRVGVELEMPAPDAPHHHHRPHGTPSASAAAGSSMRSGSPVQSELHTPVVVRRRRRQGETPVIDEHKVTEDAPDHTWYLYIPGLVGAGTALLVVGVVGALSFSSWRRSQGS